MGGIFLINLLIKMISIFILGYLFIKWFPDVEWKDISEIIVQCVLNPIRFFAASIAFMAGLVVQGNVLKKEYYTIIRLLNGKAHKELLIIPFHFIIIYFLSLIGDWQTVIFSLLSMFYGIISIDFRRQGGHHV